MKKVMQYFNPLWTFVMGMIGTLILTIFLPGINTASEELAANPAVSGGHYWALSQSVTSLRLIIFVACLLLTLFFTFEAWLSRKD
jgi:hypothetical protein